MQFLAICIILMSCVLVSINFGTISDDNVCMLMILENIIQIWFMSILS